MWIAPQTFNLGMYSLRWDWTQQEDEKTADEWRIQQPLKDKQVSLEQGAKICDHGALGYGSVARCTHTRKHYPFRGRK